MSKSRDAFRTISEVAEWLGIQTHVLRFWESKFTQIKPVKRAGGRRYYRPGDMMLLGGIKKLLHDDGITIKGVQKILREKGGGHVSAMSPPVDEPQAELIDASASETVVSFNAKAREGATPAADPPAENADQTRQIAMDLDQPAPDEPLADIEAAPAAASPVEATEPLPLPGHDLPDPAPADTLTPAPGPLSHLAALTDLTGSDIREIAALATDLRAWHARATNRSEG